VLTKSDLETDLPARLAEVSAVAAGAPVHAVSCVTGEGVDALRTYFDGGRTVALVGPSGAGKSTLVNLLLGAAAQEVSALAADGRGRHTTTNRALFPVPGGGVVLDTPGMRELRVWDVDDSLDDAFDDVARLAAACCFGDCRHDREPGCAVHAALATGELDAARFQSYVKLRREAESHALRADARTANEAKRRIKLLSRAMRASPKGRMSRE
jgi:ribosome biogenesis GTPase